MTLPLLASLTSFGCAEQVHLLDRGSAGGAPPTSFWPPPGATAVWSSGPTNDVRVGQTAERIASALSNAGYEKVRWYPIGVRYDHGFAATTRLERINADATIDSTPARWTSVLPEAADLLWLENSRRPSLLAPGRYRVFLVAFTDLPIARQEHRAPRQTEETIMEAPGVPAATFPAARPARGYQVIVYVYEYDSDSRGEGAFVASDPQMSAADHVRLSGLSALGDSSRIQAY